MNNEDFFIILYIFIAVLIATAVWEMVKEFVPWMSRRKAREKPRDALQKLLVDLKLSSKVNRESEIRYIRFQGDRLVYRKKRYRVVGMIPDPRCFVFGIRVRKLPLTSILLCPPELCTALNAREISIRARAIQRWDNLVWVPVLTEKDISRIRVFEQIWTKYLDYCTIVQGRVEFNEISFDNWYEAADGAEYQGMIERQERMQASPAPETKTVEEGAA